MEILDIDAFVPPARRKIVFRGKTHEVLNLLDLTNREYVQVLALDAQIREKLEEGKTQHARRSKPTLFRRIFGRRDRDLSGDSAEISVVRAQIAKLVPTLSNRELDTMKLFELGSLLEFISKSPEAGGGPLASAPALSN